MAATPCVISEYNPSGNGYPVITRNGVGFNHHRYVYIRAHGNLPANIVVRHTCDNPRCINLEHLVAGTQLDNMRDMIERNRAVHNGMPGEANPAAVLNIDTVAEIRRMYETGTYHQRELAAKFRVSQSQISRVVSGRSWRVSTSNSV